MNGLFGWLDDAGETERMNRKRAVDRVMERKQEQQREVATAAAEERRAEIFEDLIKIVGDELAEEAKSDVYAESTKKQYQYYLKRFRAWCIEQELNSADPTPETVAAFLIEVAGASEKKFYRQAVNARTAISAAWEAARESNPTSDPLVNATLRWLKDRHIEAASEPDIDSDPPSVVEH